MIIYLQRVYKDKTKKDDNGLVENNFLSHLTHYNQIFIDNLNGGEIKFIDIIEKNNHELLIDSKLIQIDEELGKTHYGEHADKPFFPGLVEYITSSPSLAMVIEGDEAITTIRKLVGATNPLEADLGTIRGDFGMDTGRNIIHASDAPESAEREIALFFNEDEICDYQIVDNDLIYE